jgi:acetolactate synthase I/II/III large subunit
MQATEFVVEALKTEGITHLFAVPGGLLDPFLPTLSSTSGVTPVIAAHEGGATYMADGYARASGRFGASFVIGGPGISNTVTAAAAARTDGSPIVIFSGQVPTDWEGRGGFQDSSPATLDDVAMLSPLTASSLEVENVHLFDHHLRSSLTRMLAGGQGPVHLSIPLDVQRDEVHAPWQPLDRSLYSPGFIDPGALERVWKLILPDNEDTRPSRILALVGAGVDKANAAAHLVAFAERHEIPVATTLRAKGVFPEDHRLSLGVFGYAGHRHAIETILSDEVEVLLVLGSGLNQRDTLYWDRKMLPTRALVHVDINPEVPGRTWHTEVPVVGDCGRFLDALLKASPARGRGVEATRQERSVWLEKIRSSGPRHYDFASTKSDAVPLHPARVITELREVMPRDEVLLVDSGAHRAFCGHYWEAYGPRSYISATNLGPMGWAIPAAIGAKVARPERPLAVVTGDGCMLMHGMEIQTAARYGIAVIFVVINNSALGNVWLRAHQLGPGPAALTEIPTHDWAGFARSLGLQAATVETPDQLAPAFRAALEAEAPYLLDIRCDRSFATPVSPFDEAKKEWVDDD